MKQPNEDQDRTAEALQRSLIAALRDSENLDYVTAARLRAARARALEAVQGSASNRWRFAARGLGAAAALALVVGVGLKLSSSDPRPADAPTVSLASADALDILTDDDDPDLYEDLDLYQWLGAQDAPVKSAATPRA